MLNVSIVIVNYNGRGLLRQCLKSIYQNLHHTDRQYKVVVVDNNSSDDSVAMVREQFPAVRLIPLKQNSGYARGVNIGLRSIEARYYLILNMDTTIVQPHAIELMIDFMNTHSDVGLAGPKLVNPDGSTQVSCCRFPKFFYPVLRRTFLRSTIFARKIIRYYLMLDWNHQETMPVDWVIGTGMLVRHEALQQVGLMDERFFMYFEDVDWCRRFWANGWKICYLADIKIVHYYSRDSAKSMGMASLLSRLTRIHIASWLKYFIKYPGKDNIHGEKSK
jgi:GT2 family glycosyltransferase